MWLTVELAVCEAWAKAGVIPQEDMVKLRAARHDLTRLNIIFEQTRHDMTAFTRSITETIGEEGRWIHLGLTSSDVIDTAQGLQLVEASDLLLEGLANLKDTLHNKAIEFKHTLMMGRTHGIHAGESETTTQVVTNGGRVMTVVGRGSSIAVARKHAYKAAQQIKFHNSFYRNDIALHLNNL